MTKSKHLLYLRRTKLADYSLSLQRAFNRLGSVNQGCGLLLARGLEKRQSVVHHGPSNDPEYTAIPAIHPLFSNNFSFPQNLETTICKAISE